MATTSILVLVACLAPGGGHAQAPATQSNAPSEPSGLSGDLAERYAWYARQYGRVLKPGSEEFDRRKELFAKRAAFVAMHNSRADRRWTAGINRLSDHTEAELANLHGWRGRAAAARGEAAAAHAPASLVTPGEGASLPQTFDKWTGLSSLARVRDQDSCGSCWAMASSLILEAHAEIYGTSSGRQLSPQELVDCVPNDRHCGGSGGCDGATIELAMDWAIRRGLATEEDVPYTASNGTCRKSGGRTSPNLLVGRASEQGEDPANPGVHRLSSREHSFLASRRSGVGMKAWERLPVNEYAPLVRALLERGPVGVSVDAEKWHEYSSGVFDGCGRDAVLGHAVVLVGIGVESGSKYWLIQNSWGKDWGEGGRIKLLRHDNEDHCGVDHHPEKGTGCTGGPVEVKVCGMCGVLYDAVVPHFRN